MKNLLFILLSLQLVLLPTTTYAQNSNAFLDYFNLSQGSGPADFVVKRYPNQKLIPVRLIGGMNRPGFYQIPEETSLLTLLAYAGGANQQANIEDVLILKTSEKKSVPINIRDLMTNPQYSDPIIQANDIVFIQEKKPWFSNNTVTALAVVSSIAAIVLSGYLIRDRVQGKY